MCHGFAEYISKTSESHLHLLLHSLNAIISAFNMNTVCPCDRSHHHCESLIISMDYQYPKLSFVRELYTFSYYLHCLTENQASPAATVNRIEGFYHHYVLPQMIYLSTV